MPSMAAKAADKIKSAAAGLEGKLPENLKGQEKAGRKG